VDQKGVSGESEGRQIKIGSTAFLNEEINKLDARQKKRVLNPKSKHSHVYLGVDGRLVAVFVFGDALRKSASSTIEKLHRWDYQLALVSGDGVATTKTIGQKIGIEAAYGAKLPQDKADFVAKLQKQGFQVAMVGDGINDAPALVQADLSMAIYSGGQLSKETADITLMRGEPGQVVEFLEFAVQVNKKIKQNLIFTFLYNVISIPVAISGLLTPLVAACAMLFSSLSVTANTLMLVRKNT
jgi:P-type E1-E2 ATPase